MANIKVLLENEEGSRVLCVGDLLYQDAEPHIRVTQERNPFLKIDLLNFVVTQSSIKRSQERAFDFECVAEGGGAVRCVGAF